MNVEFNQIKELLEKKGYYADEELIYDTYLSLLHFGNSELLVGQDIHALCLEGPPGAGKTFFAEVYSKISSDLFNEPVSFIEYQCEPSTGKTELFEDLNISAAIKNDYENVNLPGKLVLAIEEVNKGKKVVLFLDEYDKAREETDAFLLQFLQSGKINCNQLGDLAVKKEYIRNLQVIICKNDYREELSGPLSRRLRIIRLDYMLPTIFSKVANSVLLEKSKNKVENGLITLVSIFYNKIYEQRDIFSRVPSCSEMLIAITDADKLMKYANAPKSVIYNKIINGLFKSKDDINTFEEVIVKKDINLRKIIDDMKKVDTKKITVKEFEKEILMPYIEKQMVEIKSELQKERQILMQDKQTVKNQLELLRNRIKEYGEKLTSLSTKKEDSKKITIGESALDLINDEDTTMSNFNDEMELIKRGKSILSVTKDDVVSVATLDIEFSKLTDKINKELLEYAFRQKIVAYENGFLLVDNNIKLMNLRKVINDKMHKIKFLTDSLIMPYSYTNNILTYIKELLKIYDLLLMSFLLIV